MAWLYLCIAGLLEVVWAFEMKNSSGFTHPARTILMLITMIGSFAFLGMAMRTLPLGTAYAIWTGIGAIGVYIVSVVCLGEPLTLARSLAVSLIAAGLVTLSAVR